MNNGRIMLRRENSYGVIQITSITYNCVTQKRRDKIDISDRIPLSIL